MPSIILVDEEDEPLSNINFATPVKQRQTSSMFMAELRKELKEFLENLML